MSYRDVKRTVHNVRTPSYSFGEIHKLIPANEATEEKGKIQEASWGTAVENEEDVAGEDTKIKRPKAEKVKEVTLGVGHLATDSPLDTKVKKQLANLKQIIKNESVHAMDDVDTAGLLSEQQVDETGEDEPLDPTIEQASSLGEALGFEKPRRT